LLVAGLCACGETASLTVDEGSGAHPVLPPPRTTLIPTVHIAPAAGWADGATPRAAAGLQVQAFARGLDHPRWLLVLPNGDVLVAETNAPARPEDAPGWRGWVMQQVMKQAGAITRSANRITLLRDSQGTGVADVRSVLIDGLNAPFGMAQQGDALYVANTDAVLRFPYRAGQTRIASPGQTVAALPAGPINHHWTKNLLISADGRMLYVSVGSNSNVGEHGMAAEQGRAAIWQIDLSSGRQQAYATGLRNPNGMAWEPGSGMLWAVVNERDELGSDLVPDYLTSVRAGGFYGWPYSYFGAHRDRRAPAAEAGTNTEGLVPDYALGPHTASLGLAWSAGNRLPAAYAQGMFIAQHGSWNRQPFSGYKVIFVPFENGQPAGAAVDVLGGFLSDDGSAYGRPVGVAVDRAGGLLVADDVGNTVWRVTAAP